MLNLFYAEPDGDRWIPFDRHPRRIVRRVLRGPDRIGGQRRMFLNLCAGFDRLGIPYRLNDYGYARRHPWALACVVGKPFLLDTIEWKNPILFGAAGYSHPIDDLDLFARRRVRKVLVPGPWVREMCRPYWGADVESWPVGIDTRTWREMPPSRKRFDVLLYDKVRWNREQLESSLVQPIRELLRERQHPFVEIRYGCYEEHDYRIALAQARTMIFLCESETQGLAYQQALSCGVPVLAWDRGGAWRDPAYYPDRVNYEPVTSVPYWDDRCGMRFADASAFAEAWPLFWDACLSGHFRPRDFIVEALTLERCAQRYADVASRLG